MSEKTNIVDIFIEKISTWDEVSIGDGDFDAKTFLYKNKEFGHIHKNGFLDISFPAETVKKLLEKNLVSKHLFVPKTSLTFKLKNIQDIDLATKILKLSYLQKFALANKNIDEKLELENIHYEIFS